ncbi:hypothetical protein EB796_007918 [Bugula neritina]|uniref:Uncharacterized protein n=1 Tax=Bugula neritina TaxID=10212 RepID=A0A7J7K6E6_BUGNE|nr:hypothetical protein EB796_007918 [Bugula neritina]
MAAAARRRKEESPVGSVVATYLRSAAKSSARNMEDEDELKSESRLLYPTESDPAVVDSDEDDELQSSGARYLFPISAFDPEGDADFADKDIVRDSIIHDIVTSLIRRAVSKASSSNTDIINLQVKQPLLSRDDIIKEALNEAKMTYKRPSKGRLNSRPIIPPIKPVDDPDIRELIRKGKSQGYSEAAMLKTKRENEIRRLLVPSKEEADTVELWRLEEKYRSSINRLQGYTT